MYLDLARMPHKYLGRGRLRRGNLRGLGVNLTIPGRRDLGTVSIPVAGSMVYGSSPVRFRPVGPARPVSPWLPSSPMIPILAPVQPGGGYPTGAGYMTPYGGSYGAGSQYGQQGSLAVAQQILATNPGSLTPQQWQQLQAAGQIPGTLPYGSGAAITPTAASSSSAIDP